MKNGILIAVLSFLAASGPLLAIIDGYVEIGPSDKAEGYHTKLKLNKQRGGKLLLTLPRIDGASGLEAWLVVCEKARGKEHLNFRYVRNWSKTIIPFGMGAV